MAQLSDLEEVFVAPRPQIPISGRDLWATEFSESRWLIESIWPDQACGFIAGPSGARKTWLALELCLSVVTGKPALGRFKAEKPGPALYVAGEDQLRNLQSRMKLLARGRGISADDLKDLHFLAEQGLLSCEGARERLEAYCQKLQPRLVVLDPLVRMHGTDENSASEMQPIFAFLRHLQRTRGVSLLLTHHHRKSRGEERGNGRKMEMLRGTGDLGAWADTVIAVERHGEDSAAPSLVLVAKQRDVAEFDPFMVTLEMSLEEAKLVFHEGDASELLILEIMKSILETLHESGNSLGELLKGDLERATRGSNALKREALERLSKQGRVQVLFKNTKAKDGKNRNQKFVRLVRSTPAGTASSGLAGVPPAQPPTPAAPLGGAGVGPVGRENEPPPGLPVGSLPSRQTALSLQDFSVVSGNSGTEGDV